MLKRVAAFLFALGIVLSGLVGWALLVPTPRPVPSAGGDLGRVHLVEPGVGRSNAVHLRIENNRIASIGPAQTDGGPFADVYVLPGLSDVHVHLPAIGLPGDAEYTSLLLLAHGVTTARLLGGTSLEQSRALSERIERGEIPGPRWFNCGSFIDGPDPVIPGAVVVSTPDAARSTVHRLADAGADCIKAYDRLDRASTIALREAAHARGLAIVGHTPQDVLLEDARLDDVQHLRGVHPPFADEGRGYPELLRPWHRLDDARLDHAVAVARRFGMAFTPTLVAVEGTLRARDWESWRRSATMRWWPPHLRDGLWSAEVGFNPVRFMDEPDFEMVARSLDQMKRAVARLHAARIPLHTGTDSNAPNIVPGVSLVRELELLVDAGLSPEEALAASTRTSAEFLGITSGKRLVAGAPADLVLFREDPTRDLSALATLAGVVRNGRLYTREDLEARIALAQHHYESAGFQWVVMPPIRAALRLVSGWLRR